MRKVMLACGLAAVGLLAVGCDSTTPAPGTNKSGASGDNPSAAAAREGAAKAREMERGAGGMTAPTGK